MKTSAAIRQAGRIAPTPIPDVATKSPVGDLAAAFDLDGRDLQTRISAFIDRVFLGAEKIKPALGERAS
jgi:hypothetical protein